MSFVGMVAIKTPCIGVCSTGIGDSVCRGCKRFAHEVIQWNAYTAEQREAIMARIESLLNQVVRARITVVDKTQLQQQLQHHGMRFDPTRSESAWLYEALRAFGGQLHSMDKIGCQVNPPWESHSVTQLKEDIESTFYELTCVHYERYFPGHL